MPRIRLPGVVGSPEFNRAYEDALVVACLIRRSRASCGRRSGHHRGFGGGREDRDVLARRCRKDGPQVSMEWDGQLPVHPRPCGARRCDARNDPGGSTKDWRVRSRVHCGRVQRLHAIKGAGLPLDCQPHGLRKAAGRRLAEAGCSSRELMAVLGHKTLSEAERYTRDADQARLASAAVARLEGRKVNSYILKPVAAGFGQMLEALVTSMD